MNHPTSSRVELNVMSDIKNKVAPAIVTNDGISEQESMLQRIAARLQMQRAAAKIKGSGTPMSKLNALAREGTLIIADRAAAEAYGITNAHLTKHKCGDLVRAVLMLADEMKTNEVPWAVIDSFFAMDDWALWRNASTRHARRGEICQYRPRAMLAAYKMDKRINDNRKAQLPALLDAAFSGDIGF